MQLMSVFSLGYTLSDFKDFGGWEAKIKSSTPLKLTKATISSSPTGCGYFTYLIHATDAVWMLEYALIDNGIQDFIRWLESIYLGCSESFLLMNQEGPEELVRAYQEFRCDELRLTMISNVQHIYDSVENKYIENTKFAKLIRETGEKQVVFDILMNKWDFIEAMYVLTHITAKKVNETIFKSEVIETFIKELPEDHKTIFFQKG